MDTKENVITRQVIKTAWKYINALVPDRQIHDDVLQEALIAYYQTYESKPDPAYATRAMRNQIISRSQRQTWTGNENPHGRPVDPLRRQWSLNYLDEPAYSGNAESSDSDSKWDLMPDTGMTPEELSELREEIRDLLHPLSQEQFFVVMAHAYYGLTHEEISKHYGYTKIWSSRRWNEAVKILREDT